MVWVHIAPSNDPARGPAAESLLGKSSKNCSTFTFADDADGVARVRLLLVGEGGCVLHSQGLGRVRSRDQAGEATGGRLLREKRGASRKGRARRVKTSQLRDPTSCFGCWRGDKARASKGNATQQPWNASRPRQIPRPPPAVVCKRGLPIPTLMAAAKSLQVTSGSCSYAIMTPSTSGGITATSNLSCPAETHPAEFVKRPTGRARFAWVERLLCSRGALRRARGKNSRPPSPPLPAAIRCPAPRPRSGYKPCATTHMPPTPFEMLRSPTTLKLLPVRRHHLPLKIRRRWPHYSRHHSRPNLGVAQLGNLLPRRIVGVIGSTRMHNGHRMHAGRPLRDSRRPPATGRILQESLAHLALDGFPLMCFTADHGDATRGTTQASRRRRRAHRTLDRHSKVVARRRSTT